MSTPAAAAALQAAAAASLWAGGGVGELMPAVGGNAAAEAYTSFWEKDFKLFSATLSQLAAGVVPPTPTATPSAASETVALTSTFLPTTAAGGSGVSGTPSPLGGPTPSPSIQGSSPDPAQMYQYWSKYLLDKKEP